MFTKNFTILGKPIKKSQLELLTTLENNNVKCKKAETQCLQGFKLINSFIRHAYFEFGDTTLNKAESMIFFYIRGQN